MSSPVVLTMSSTPEYIISQLLQYLGTSTGSNLENAFTHLSLRASELVQHTSSELVAYDTCQRAYFRACPRGYLTDGIDCIAPLGSLSRCGRIPVEPTPALREAQAARCALQWPCERDCEAFNLRQDWQSPCPMDWTKEAHLCSAPSSYAGPCQKKLDLTPLNAAMRQRFSVICDVSWPCKPAEVEGHDCPPGWTVKSEISLCVAPASYAGPCPPTLTFAVAKHGGCGLAHNWAQGSGADQGITLEWWSEGYCGPGRVPSPCPVGWERNSDRCVNSDNNPDNVCGNRIGVNLSNGVARVYASRCGMQFDCLPAASQDEEHGMQTPLEGAGPIGIRSNTKFIRNLLLPERQSSGWAVNDQGRSRKPTQSEAIRDVLFLRMRIIRPLSGRPTDCAQLLFYSCMDRKAPKVSVAASVGPIGNNPVPTVGIHQMARAELLQTLPLRSLSGRGHAALCRTSLRYLQRPSKQQRLNAICGGHAPNAFRMQ